MKGTIPTCIQTNEFRGNLSCWLRRFVANLHRRTSAMIRSNSVFTVFIPLHWETSVVKFPCDYLKICKLRTRSLLSRDDCWGTKRSSHSHLCWFADIKTSVQTKCLPYEGEVTSPRTRPVTDITAFT